MDEPRAQAHVLAIAVRDVFRIGKPAFLRRRTELRRLRLRLRRSAIFTIAFDTASSPPAAPRKPKEFFCPYLHHFLAPDEPALFQADGDDRIHAVRQMHGIRRLDKDDVRIIFNDPVLERPKLRTIADETDRLHRLARMPCSGTPPIEFSMMW